MIDCKIFDLTIELEKKGVRAFFNKLTGQGDKREQLEVLQKARASLEAQKQQELREYDAKQLVKRDQQAKNQQEERQRIGERLTHTKARQDQQFIEREAERAGRLAKADQSQAHLQAKAKAKAHAAEAQRASIKDAVQLVEACRIQRVETSEILGHARWRDQSRDLGYER